MGTLYIYLTLKSNYNYKYMDCCNYNSIINNDNLLTLKGEKEG